MDLMVYRKLLKRAGLPSRLRAHGLAAITSPLHGEDHRFESGWAHFSFFSLRSKSLGKSISMGRLSVDKVPFHAAKLFCESAEVYFDEPSF
jgi:hypothetical protein